MGEFFYINAYLENFLLVAFQEKKATVGDAGNPSLLK
jgi:hypothetical protein